MCSEFGMLITDVERETVKRKPILASYYFAAFAVFRDRITNIFNLLSTSSSLQQFFYCFIFTKKKAKAKACVDLNRK